MYKKERKTNSSPIMWHNPIWDDIKLAQLVTAQIFLPISSVRFRQNPKKLRTQIYMDLSHIDPKARVPN